MESFTLTYQLALPHLHRTNVAKKAIDASKRHFFSGLASVDHYFPIHLWCCLIL